MPVTLSRGSEILRQFDMPFLLTTGYWLLDTDRRCVTSPESRIPNPESRLFDHLVAPLDLRVEKTSYPPESTHRAMNA